jgi:hypothetical protein
MWLTRLGARPLLGIKPPHFQWGGAAEIEPKRKFATSIAAVRKDYLITSLAIESTAGGPTRASTHAIDASLSMILFDPWKDDLLVLAQQTTSDATEVIAMTKKVGILHSGHKQIARPQIDALKRLVSEGYQEDDTQFVERYGDDGDITNLRRLARQLLIDEKVDVLVAAGGSRSCDAAKHESIAA